MSIPASTPPSYFLLLEALLSELPDPRLSADTGDWCSAILRLRDKYGDQCADLFDDIRLIERPPLKPVSPEVGDFVAWIQAAGDAGVWNPSYDIMEAGANEKTRIRERISDRLGNYSAMIPQMAADVRDILAYKDHLDVANHLDITDTSGSAPDGAGSVA